MDTVRVSSKGQIVVPKAMREALDIRAGTELTAELLPERAVVLRVRDKADLAAQVRRLAGSLAHRAKRMTPAEEDAVILAAVKADDERTKSVKRTKRSSR